MEGSKVNGDVRLDFGREVIFMPQVVEPHIPREGFPRNCTSRSLCEYGSAGPPPLQSRLKLFPEFGGFGPGGSRIPGRIFRDVEEYSFSQSTPRDSPDSGGFPRFFGSVGKGHHPMVLSQEYSSDQEYPPFPASVPLCSECPPRAAPCDFGDPGPCIRSLSEYPIMTNLRTAPERWFSAEFHHTHPQEVYPAVGQPEALLQQGPQEAHQSAQSVSSKHGSRCDLKEFQQWREMKGSRESLQALPIDLQKHLRECRCHCDHLGYGNYETLSDGPVAHITRSQKLEGEPSVYTQISYPDSPRSTVSSNGSPSKRKAPGELSTRHWWLVGLVFLVAACTGVGVGVPLALRGDPSQSLEQRVENANRILSESPLIDGHNDLPWNIRSFIHNQLEKLRLNESLKDVEPWSISNWSHTDIPRLKEGRVGGVFWVAYTPCATQYLNTVQLTLEQIDLIKRVIHRYKNYMKLVTSANDIQRVFKEGKIASLVGIEGGHSISNSLGTLRMLYELGARYLTLTHTCNTPWATSSIVESQKMSGLEHVGLNDFGKKVVLEMNRLGMMVDLSHVSTQTMRDALATTRAPVIFSHSSSRALCHNPRNVPDDILLQVKSNGGIVMVSFFADHVNCNGKANVSHVASEFTFKDRKTVV